MASPEHSELVKRAAEAIKAVVPVGYGMTDEEAARYAREVMNAMREPTPTMIDASRRALSQFLQQTPRCELEKLSGYHPPFTLFNESVKAAVRYRAMIDEALSVSPIIKA